MIELYDGGVYLLNGTELVADNGEAAAAIEAKTGKKVDKKKAARRQLHMESLLITIHPVIWRS